MDWGHRKLPWWKCQCSQELVKIYFYYKHTEELFWSEHYGEQALKRCFSTVRPKQKLNTTRLDDSLKRQPRARLMFVYNEIQYWCDVDTVQPLQLVRVTYRECREDKNQRSTRKISLSTKSTNIVLRNYFAANVLKIIHSQLQNTEVTMMSKPHAQDIHHTSF